MSSRPTICRVHDKSGITYLRDGILVAFFLPKPLHENAAGVADVLDLFLKSVPSDAIKWAGVGASSEEWKPATKNSIDKCRAMLVPSAAKKRAITTFELAGGAQASDAPEHAFTLIATRPERGAPDEVDLVEMVFRPASVDEAHVDAFVETVQRMAERVAFISGYASPALLYSEVGEGRAMDESRAIAERHPGFDVQKNKLGCLDQNHWVRGARWLTFLGPDILKTLGGVKKLRAALHADIVVKEIATGVMIRAGRVPEFGDSNKRIDTPLLRNLARVLEPVTLFNEPILLSSYFADGDESALTKWERRFL